MSAAPETVSGSRRLLALGAVALAAFGIALAARESGALAPLEREALKARFDVRGAEPVKGMLVVGIDAKSFGELQQRWPFPRSLHGQVGAPAARRGRARDRLRRPVHRADQAARGFRPLRRDRRGRRRRAGHEREQAGRQHERPGWRRQPPQHRCTRGRLRPPQRHKRRDRQLPATRPASSTASPWSRRERLQGHPPRRGRLPRRQGLDRLPRPARNDPDRVVLGRHQWARARGHDPRPHRGRGRHRADAARRALHAGGRRGADAGRRGPGERDLDRAARAAAALGPAWRGPPAARPDGDARPAHALAPPAGSGGRRDRPGRRRVPRRCPAPVRERQHRGRGRSAAWRS